MSDALTQLCLDSDSLELRRTLRRYGAKGRTRSELRKELKWDFNRLDEAVEKLHASDLIVHCSIIDMKDGLMQGGVCLSANAF